MAKSGRQKIALFSFILMLAFLMGCGGGSSVETSGGIGLPPAEPPSTEPPPAVTLPPKVLSWQPPTSYSDNSPLDPLRDLANIEIYVKETGPFSNGDSPMALVSAVDSATGQPATSFNLANLGPFLSLGVRYQVSLRAVAISGLKSDFSPPAAFSF